MKNKQKKRKKNNINEKTERDTDRQLLRRRYLRYLVLFLRPIKDDSYKYHGDRRRRRERKLYSPAIDHALLS